MINPDLVVVTGPLSPFQDGFGSWLEAAGYSKPMRAEHLRVMAGLSRWLQERGEVSGCLSRPLLAEFLAGLPGSPGQYRTVDGGHAPADGVPARSRGCAPG